LSFAQGEKAHQLFSKGDSLIGQGQCVAAIESLQQAIAIYSSGHT